MTDESTEVQQPSSDEMYTEMHENGTFPASERWPEMVGTDEWQDAYSRYQSDHEMPEEERVAATAELVETENAQASEEESTEEE